MSKFFENDQQLKNDSSFFPFVESNKGYQCKDRCLIREDRSKIGESCSVDKYQGWFGLWSYDWDYCDPNLYEILIGHLETLVTKKKNLKIDKVEEIAEETADLKEEARLIYYTQEYDNMSDDNMSDNMIKENKSKKEKLEAINDIVKRIKGSLEKYHKDTLQKLEGQKQNTIPKTNTGIYKKTLLLLFLSSILSTAEAKYTTEEANTNLSLGTVDEYKQEFYELCQKKQCVLKERKKLIRKWALFLHPDKYTEKYQAKATRMMQDFNKFTTDKKEQKANKKAYEEKQQKEEGEEQEEEEEREEQEEEEREEEEEEEGEEQEEERQESQERQRQERQERQRQEEERQRQEQERKKKFNEWKDYFKNNSEKDRENFWDKWDQNANNIQWKDIPSIHAALSAVLISTLSVAEMKIQKTKNKIQNTFTELKKKLKTNFPDKGSDIIDAEIDDLTTQFEQLRVTTMEELKKDMEEMYPGVYERIQNIQKEIFAN